MVRRRDKYHTDKREHISPVAVCFEELHGFACGSTNEM